MKLIHTLQHWKTQFQNQLQSHEIYIKSFISLCLLTLFATVIWLAGPYLVWADATPFATPEKRIYTILILFLAWFLKFLIIDLSLPKSSVSPDAKIKSKLEELQNRFFGALQFLQKTTVSRQGKTIPLKELPWYLLIGPAHAGKTTLLAHSGVNFILQRQFQDKDKLDLASSTHCDWWITRDASILDVPGHYLTNTEGAPGTKAEKRSLIWQFFLNLIKKERGKNGVNGLIIALPLPDIIKSNDPKLYPLIIRDLFRKLQEFQHSFPQGLPCQIVITKCDLLPGFTEFFAESHYEDIIQAWGITLPKATSNEKLADLFTQRFNILIRKLNEQLIFRLHQERNPMARPYIKDFPLQVERMRIFLNDFIKKFTAAHFKLSVQGVYLTSALQVKREKATKMLSRAAMHATGHEMQVFKEPPPPTQAYFVKQLLNHVLFHTDKETHFISKHLLKHYFAYTAAASVIVFVAIMLFRDFEVGVDQARNTQHTLSHYQEAIAHLQNPEEQLASTFILLNSLQESVKATGKFNIFHLMSFYSNKSQQKTNEVYRQALQSILLPEIKNYFEYYLQHPVNKNADDIYMALKAYLMMGDMIHYDAGYLAKIIHQIQPKSVKNMDQALLKQHVFLAFHSGWKTLELNAQTIQETRQYLTYLPSLKLSYIILKNMDNIYLTNNINIAATIAKTPLMGSESLPLQIPAIFTVKAFILIMSQEAALAAREAITGNWILGDITPNKNLETVTPLIEQLRATYVNQYVQAWENMLASIQLSSPKDLAQTDATIVKLMGINSPLLQLLQVIHDNTYFVPIATSSLKLQSLGLLLEKNSQAQNQLYEIFAGLQALHQYLQVVLTAWDEKKAAFEILSKRMVNQGAPDAITQLRLIADKNPEPIKNWLNKIADDAWHFLTKESGSYLDTSWQDQVIRVYQTEIADHFPFATSSRHEVAMQQFINFFGNPGIVLNFYNEYLQPFIDTSGLAWRWKKIDNKKLAFSDTALRQIQHAVEIHRSFFPHSDNKPYVQFSLKSYEVSKDIQRIAFTIDDKQFIDDGTHDSNPHVITWPTNASPKMTSIQLTLTNQQSIHRLFPGDWGWFKLVNQTYENRLSKNKIIINLSQDTHSVKYLLLMQNANNPFTSLNLPHFRFSPKLTEV